MSVYRIIGRHPFTVISAREKIGILLGRNGALSLVFGMRFVDLGDEFKQVSYNRSRKCEALISENCE